MTEGETHFDVVERVASEGWDFQPQFIRKLIGEQAEYKEATLLHALAGKIPDKTGRHFCPYCDGYMDETACSVFEKRAKRWLRREVLVPYMEATCPECHTPIDDIRDARVVEESPALTREEAKETDLSDLPPPETELKTIYKPCECLHEHGEGKIRWDLDKDAVREAVQNGGLAAFYEGPVFRSEGIRTGR